MPAVVALQQIGRVWCAFYVCYVNGQSTLGENEFMMMNESINGTCDMKVDDSRCSPGVNMRREIDSRAHD